MIIIWDLTKQKTSKNKFTFSCLFTIFASLRGVHLVSVFGLRSIGFHWLTIFLWFLVSFRLLLWFFLWFFNLEIISLNKVDTHKLVARPVFRPSFYRGGCIYKNKLTGTSTHSSNRSICSAYDSKKNPLPSIRKYSLTFLP